MKGDAMTDHDHRLGSIEQPSARPSPGAGSHVHCPRCGLTIATQALGLVACHCPRCIVRSRALVELRLTETRAA